MSRAPRLPKHFFEIDFHSAAKQVKQPREFNRLLALAFLQQKRSVTEASKAFNVTNNAVHKWVSRFKKGGLEALKDQGGGGRKKRLPEDKEEDFKEAVMQAQKQKNGGSITGKDVMRLLKEKFNIKCEKTAVYSLLHRVGLSWISGRSRHPKQDKEAQKSFKKTSALI